MTAGFGPQQWALDEWGGSEAALTVAQAFAISTHEVVVVLSKPPQDITGFLVGDVHNPGSWEVSIPAESRSLDIAGVTAYAAPLQWTIRTLQRLPDSLASARATITSLKDANGGVAQLPNYADFAGVTELAISTPQRLASAKTRSGKDLANTTAPGAQTVSGTLVIQGGDYTLVEGTELVKKLIMRRLMTTPGEFFHIPKYGVGLALKQPLPGGGLVRLKARIEKQVLLEPDIASVSVALSQTGNMLKCVVSAVLARTNQQVNVALDSPIGQG